MTYKKYTQCYSHTPPDKPFNEKDLLSFGLGISAPFLAAALIGFIGGGPAGIFFGAVMTGIGYAATITAVANEWLNHRLICLTPDRQPKCAVGIVTTDQETGTLGDFDNDEFFDVRLMPHRPNDDYADGKPGTYIDANDQETKNHPANDIPNDGFQGFELIKPNPNLSDLSYKLDRTKLHCEAEGNFWVKMKEYALLQGLVVSVLSGLGVLGGAAAGCAIGGIFGPIGCLIGAIIGAILGWALGTGAGFLASAAITFNADPGEIEDTNVGDKSFGPISNGDKVVVYGEHVYDGFHEGWHEFHPLIAVIKLSAIDSSVKEADQYLEWNPSFTGTPPIIDLPDMPNEIKALSEADMKIGLESEKFRKRAEFFKKRWCRLLCKAYDDATRKTQALDAHRWTIHPTVDGCKPADDDSGQTDSPSEPPIIK
jgi:hypothetical protein